MVNKSFSISLWIRPVTLSGTLVFVESGTTDVHWCCTRSVFGPILSLSSIWHHIVQTWSEYSNNER